MRPDSSLGASTTTAGATADEDAAGERDSSTRTNRSKNIPLNQLDDKLAAAVKNKTLPLILVCRTGARSARAVAMAKKLGYDNAQSMAGGLKAWQTANLPVEKSAA